MPDPAIQAIHVLDIPRPVNRIAVNHLVRFRLRDFGAIPSRATRCSKSNSTPQCELSHSATRPAPVKAAASPVVRAHGARYAGNTSHACARGEMSATAPVRPVLRPISARERAPIRWWC